jgi:protein ImuB
MTGPAELYASLYAREFPAQALLRLRPELREKAFVVLAGEPPLQSVCSINSKARALGVVRGMTRIELDTFSSVVVQQRSEAEEAAVRAVLLECAGTCSPRIEDQSTGDAFLCVIDIAGMERLFATPQSLAQELSSRVRALGIWASVAVSQNVYAAICLARANSVRMHGLVIEPGTEAAALARLPLAVLDLSIEHAETLELWGVRTLGALAALPERELIARMGQAGKRLRQLARGELPHLFVPVEPRFRLEERIELDTPVEHLDSLLFVASVMLEQLIVRATARVLALTSVTLVLSLEGGSSHTRTVRPALPSTDKALWLKLLHLDLEAHPPPAAILALTLTAEPGSTSKVQLGLFSPQLPEPARLDVTLARIRAIVGEDYVGRAVLSDTHQPDAFQMESFRVPSGQACAAVPDRSMAAVRQLRPPERVTVILHGHAPATIYFREKRYEVEQAYGPWRISGDWWSPASWTFEQWDLIARSSEGLLLSCCLVQDSKRNCWQMAALYD